MHGQPLAGHQDGLDGKTVPGRKLLDAHPVPAGDQPQGVAASDAVNRGRRTLGHGATSPRRGVGQGLLAQSERDRNRQMGARENPIRGQPVRVLQRLHARPVANGDGAERVSAHDRVTGPALVPVGRELRESRGESFGGVDRKLQAVRPPGCGRRTLEAGIEPAELPDGDSREIRGERELDLTVESHRSKVHLVGNRPQGHAVPFRLRDDLGDGDEAVYVSARLPGQAQRPYVGGFASRTVSGHRAPDVAFAPVVGGHREQRIVPELLHEPGEVVERGASGLDDVAATVVPPVLLQSVPPAGRRHELPQARRPRVRVRTLAERALHHRQQRELHGQLALLDFPHDVGQVRAGALRHAMEVFLVPSVPLDRAPDLLLVRVLQVHPVANAVPRVPVARRLLLRSWLRQPTRTIVEHGDRGRARRLRRPDVRCRRRDAAAPCGLDDRRRLRVFRHRFGCGVAGFRGRRVGRVWRAGLRGATRKHERYRQEGRRQPGADTGSARKGRVNPNGGRHVVGRAGSGRHGKIGSLRAHLYAMERRRWGQEPRGQNLGDRT